MPDPQPSNDAGAPAPSGPEGSPQVEIALGPDPSIYPEQLRPPAEPPVPPAEAPEPADESTAPETAEPVAGAAEKASPQEGDTRGTRRRAAEDAYQRGLADARAQLEQQQQLQAQRDQAERTQREATQRVEQLFAGLESPDYATQDRARQGILQMYRGNQQAQALMTTTRQQVLAEMAADFGTLKDLDGVNDADYQSLHSAPSAADLARRAFDLGKKTRDEQVARLEAELQGLRGRLVGSRATPEAHNGAGGDAGSISIESYLAMSPKDAKQLSSAQIDALTAQLAAASANGRS